MSTDTSNNNAANTTPDDSAPKASVKDKMIRFVNNNLMVLAAVGFVVALIIILLVVYFTLQRPTNMDKFAEDFCDCAEVSQSEYYNYSKDGFGYRSDLSSCFAEDFMTYSEHFNKMEKKVLLQEFQEKVLEKCPNKLAHIFEYK